MFKTIRKMQQDNKGFTLVELMVVCVVLALVLSLTCQLSFTMYKKYKLVEDRYIMQTEVEYIVHSFQKDASSGSLFTATNADLFYENMDTAATNKTFVTCPELGAFTEDETTHTLTFANISTTYTYLFVYNHYFYVLNSKTDKAYRFCLSDEIPINIEFSVALDAFAIDPSTNKEAETAVDSHGNDAEHKYLPTGLTVKVENSDKNLAGTYTLNTSFALDNMVTTGFEINMNSTEGNYLTNQYVAGWSNGELENYPDDDVKKDGVSYDDIDKPATIVRYISLVDFLDGTFTGNDPSSSDTSFNCSTRWLMMDSAVGSGVIDTLHSFRDDVLKGTVVGDEIIKLYYDWSPQIIQTASESPTLKKALQKAVTDVAYIIEMTK